MAIYKKNTAIITMCATVIALIFPSLNLYNEIRYGKGNAISKYIVNQIQPKIKKRYNGCNIKSRGGSDITSKIDLPAPPGFMITNWKEIAKEGDKEIIESRSNLLDAKIHKNGEKFTAKCVGDGKKKRVLGVVVDHYSAWRYSDIMLTLKKIE